MHSSLQQALFSMTYSQITKETEEILPRLCHTSWFFHVFPSFYTIWNQLAVWSTMIYPIHPQAPSRPSPKRGVSPSRGYLTSNVVWAKSQQPVGERYAVIEGELLGFRWDYWTDDCKPDTQGPRLVDEFGDFGCVIGMSVSVLTAGEFKQWRLVPFKGCFEITNQPWTLDISTEAWGKTGFFHCCFTRSHSTQFPKLSPNKKVPKSVPKIWSSTSEQHGIRLVPVSEALRICSQIWL